VFLTGPFVYKVKKPCALGFLDFSTLERRRHFCEEEVRVSGRFAPALYLGVVPITGTASRPRVDGAGQPFEWAVRLVQFDEANRLDAVFASGRLTADDCARLGVEVARVQDRLATAASDAPWGTAPSLLDAAALALGQIRSLRPDAASRAEAVGGWLQRRTDALLPVFARRKAAGRVRECHGDLHLANIVLHDGRMTPFDAIEFNDSLRWIDVASDLAFLTMDLASRGRGDLAAHVASAWIECTRCTGHWCGRMWRPSVADRSRERRPRRHGSRPTATSTSLAGSRDRAGLCSSRRAVSRAAASPRWRWPSSEPAVQRGFAATSSASGSWACRRRGGPPMRSRPTRCTGRR
jgi:aminoglycoside phosphotransferase family enzyme